MKSVEVNEKPIEFDRIRYQIQNAVYYFDDVQKVRIAMGNRICAAYREMAKLSGVELPKASDEDKEKAKLLKKILAEYKLITDYYADKLQGKGRIDKAINSVTGLALIRSKYDFELVENYMTLVEAEEKANKMMADAVQQHPMWERFFKDVKGCGPSIAGKLIAGLDVHEARHVSSFWSYCGVGTRTAENGERVAMSKKHTTTRTYTDKNGEEQTCNSLGYSPKLQSVCVSTLVSSILKVGKGSKYWECYYDYKNRYRNRADLKKASDMRIHRMASRQVAKAVLRDLWVEWRSYEGYELSLPYEVEYLGNAPHKFNEYHYRKAAVD